MKNGTGSDPATKAQIRARANAIRRYHPDHNGGDHSKVHLLHKAIRWNPKQSNQRKGRLSEHEIRRTKDAVRRASQEMAAGKMPHLTGLGTRVALILGLSQTGANKRIRQLGYLI